MITEKMLELILLRDLMFHSRIDVDDHQVYLGGDVYVDGSKIWARQEELLREFINPYVVDKA